MKKYIKRPKVLKYDNGGSISSTTNPAFLKKKYADPMYSNGVQNPVVESPTISNQTSSVPTTYSSQQKALAENTGDAIPTSNVPTEGQAAMSGASTGSAAGPVGAVIGMSIGAIMNMKQQQEQQEATDRALNQQVTEKRVEDSQILETYNKKGNFIQSYSKGGKLVKPNSNSLTTGKYKAIGGKLNPISDTAVEAVGNEHEEKSIDNSYGITLVDKQTNQPEANVEDGEVIIDNTNVYSDRLKFDKKHTYADMAKKLASKREKITTPLEKYNDIKTRNGVERQLAGIDMKEDLLFVAQEISKLQDNKQNLEYMKKGGYLTKYAEGGTIDPNKKGKLATRKDSVSVANSSKQTAAYYRKKGYTETIEKNPERLNTAIQFLDESADRFKRENRPNTIIEKDERNRRIIDSNLYRQDIDSNKFNQRETANAILNLDAPITQYDRRITPTSISKFVAPEGLYKDDIVSVPSYADLFEGQKTKVETKVLPKKEVPNITPKIVKPTSNLITNKPDNINKIYDTDFENKARQMVRYAKPIKGIKRYAEGGKLDDEESEGMAFVKDLAPTLLDNVGNLILTNNTPRAPQPILNRAQRINTKVNINPQLSEVQDTIGATTANILANTSNSNVARANIASARLAGLKQKNALYANKQNIESSLENQDLMNIQSVSTANTGALNEYQEALRTRANDIQGKISGNLSNLSADISNAQERADMRDYYDQVLALDALDDKTGDKARVYSRIPNASKSKKLQEVLRAEALRKKTGTKKTYNFNPINLD